jgi:molybdate transport system ATP-binding protein
LTLENISLTYRVNPVLRNISWQVQPGEQWAIVGRNSAGKSSLANIIAGSAKHYVGKCNVTNHIRERGLAYVCFEQQKTLIERDKKLDDSEFRPDAADPGTTVRHAISNGQTFSDDALEWIERLGIKHILDRGIRFVSTGEARKTLLAQAICQTPGLLILDTPTDGLDKRSQQTMKEALSFLLGKPDPVILLYRDIKDLPEGITHLLVLDEGKILTHGLKDEVLARADVQAAFAHSQHQLIDLPIDPQRQDTNTADALILKHVGVRYGDTIILNDVNWRMGKHQHTLLAGPNGSGKTTLLSLITGDNPKAYGQDITVFGIKRGSGESVWDIKRCFGVVDSASHLNFPPRQQTLHVVISGFYDSQGLYQKPSDGQVRQAKAWMQSFGLGDLVNTEFDTLSFGQQRIILLARAMVKQPKMLILDEPTLGLDAVHTQQLLDAIDHVAKTGHTQLIFVSHSVGEYPKCINQCLEFVPHDSGYQLVCRDLSPGELP